MYCREILNHTKYKILLHTKYLLKKNTEFIGNVNKYKVVLVKSRNVE